MPTTVRLSTFEELLASTKRLFKDRQRYEEDEEMTIGRAANAAVDPATLSIEEVSLIATGLGLSSSPEIQRRVIKDHLLVMLLQDDQLVSICLRRTIMDPSFGFH